MGLHGAALVIHRLIRKDKKSDSFNLPPKKCINMLLNFIFVCICWIFFRSASIGDAMIILKRIFTEASGVHYIYVYTVIYGMLLFVIQLYMYTKNCGHVQYPKISLTTWKGKIVVCMMAWIVFLFAYGGETAFVYFQF